MPLHVNVETETAQAVLYKTSVPTSNDSNEQRSSDIVISLALLVTEGYALNTRHMNAKTQRNSHLRNTTKCGAKTIHNLPCEFDLGHRTLQLILFVQEFKRWLYTFIE